MEDLQIIKNIEEEFNIQLNQFNDEDDMVDAVEYNSSSGYMINDKKDVFRLAIIEENIDNLKQISKLRKLEVLIMQSTNISNISGIEKLINLYYIDLGDNNITDISPLNNLNGLNYISLWGNQISDISPIKTNFQKKDFSYEIEDNPLKFPPKEVVSLGEKAINEYFDHAEKGTSILKEAKLIIIGEAGAGKTTFAKRVQKADAPMPKPDETTLGIEVNKWFFGGDYQYLDCDSNDYNTGYYTKIWDFGGQDIYHGTHQFFYSNKSLYVLLSDAREQKTDFNYWLNTVEQLTDEESPLIIILNKKHKHIWQIDEPGLKRRFGNIIRNVVSIDLSQTSEVIDLQKQIKTEIEKLPYIGYILPKSWIDVRTELNQLDEKFISYEHFRNICKRYGITNPQLVEIISKLFTNIGIFTHFSDDFSSLKDIIFLDANWLTKTVYLLLNHETVKEKNGRITFDEIQNIWKNDNIYFEINKFIELLMKFSLIYKINGSKNYIVPEHLPTIQPYDNWQFSDEKENYQFRYLFDNYMPKGLMARLIVSLHRYIYDNTLVWHRGVNISNSVKEPDTYAEILETYGRENRFDIRIHGKNKRDLLQIIIYHFDNILKPFNKLTHEKLVPCNCDTCKTSPNPHFYKYSHVLNAKQKSKKQIECPINFDYAHVDELIEGINDTKIRSVLLNKKFTEFKDIIFNRFSDISYQIHKEKVTESYFHSVFHAILAENGLNPISEESTSSGRIDLHLTIGKTKFLFELKLDKSAKEALKQIEDKEYYKKYLRNFKEISLIGINFSSITRNIEDIEFCTITH